MFIEFAGVLLIAAVIGLLAARLRQPMIVAFIVVGIVVGPAGAGWVTETEPMELLAQLGVTVLLFLVGLKLDPALVRKLGPVALATGIGQLAFTIVFGYLLGRALGMDSIKSLYVAVALTFSSTIIIVKLLSDKRELDTLHGRIATGFLIVQDIAVVIAMMVIGSWDVGEEGGGFGSVAIGLGGLLLGLGFLYAAVRWLLPHALRLAASSGELLLVFSVAWGATLAAAGEMLGFSKEVGAFLAGFALAATSFREAVGARLSGLRDFLLLFFFVDLGARLEFADLGAELPAAIAFSIFVLVGNPLIVLIIMASMGYRRRTGFLAGLTVAQISEFSVIFIAMGVALGHVGSSALSLVTLVGLVTIMLSTYMILYSERLYALCQPLLGPFERRVPFREQAWEQAEEQEPDVVVYGLGRYGGRLLAQLRERGIGVLGVDFDPDVVAAARHAGLPARFGDAEDVEFVHSLPLRNARWVVSTLPLPEAVAELGHALQRSDFKGHFAVALRAPSDLGQRLTPTPDMLLRPYEDAADRAAELIAERMAEPEDESAFGDE